MRIALTGATGHVGANLVRRLVELGHDVRALVHEDRRALEGVAVQAVPGDLLDVDSLVKAFSGADQVFHAAVRISIASGDEKLVHDTNVIGTRNVVEACVRAGVKRLIHFSSIHALSSTPVDQLIDESRPLASGSGLLPYDRSKSEAEQQVQAGVAKGLDAVILIPTGVLGPHDYRPSAMGQVLLDLALGRLPGLVDGAFNWVDVRDVIEGAIRASERCAAGERVLLSGHRKSLREIAVAVEHETGRKAPWFVSPMWLARASAPLVTAFARMTGKPPRVTTESLHALRNHKLISHDKATRLLDYHPRPFEETIAASIAWFKSAGAIG
ncbi:MAG: NAD-dependent epimerase/dehydratase family protein [Deltaproteobacteria bacterium]|nr:NAD-dependent epimerase/dehydratase family protein [Deltaproteobacteria bacterium]